MVWTGPGLGRTLWIIGNLAYVQKTGGLTVGNGECWCGWEEEKQCIEEDGDYRQCRIRRE